MMRWPGILAAGLVALAACSAPGDGPAVTVEHGWMRAPVPGSAMTAAYLEVVNHTDEELVIDGGSSPQFGDVSLHTMRMVDGVMQMRPMTALRVAPGQRVALAPGGDHIMLGKPRVALDSIASIELTLTRAGDPLVTVALPVSRSDPRATAP